jgi:hypothetical protein
MWYQTTMRFLGIVTVSFACCYTADQLLAGGRYFQAASDLAFMLLR